MSTETVVIDPRYCGPKTSANGGYAAGVFARVIDGPAEVTLKAPPRFDTPITLQQGEGDAFTAVMDGAEIACTRPSSIKIEPPALPDGAAIRKAHESFLNDEGMTMFYPYCFVCGKHRREGDGLRIFAGETDSGINADFWTPAENLADSDGLVSPEYIWAALDCPTAFALHLPEKLVLLGRFTVDINRRPKPRERLTVAAWRTGGEGRKHFSSSALYDERREIIAAANAVWIELNDPTMLARLKAENA